LGKSQINEQALQHDLKTIEDRAQHDRNYENCKELEDFGRAINVNERGIATN
jgi:hypothetical protein